MEPTEDDDKTAREQITISPEEFAAASQELTAAQPGADLLQLRDWLQELSRGEPTSSLTKVCFLLSEACWFRFNISAKPKESTFGAWLTRPDSLGNPVPLSPEPFNWSEATYNALFDFAATVNQPVLKARLYDLCHCCLSERKQSYRAAQEAARAYVALLQLKPESSDLDYDHYLTHLERALFLHDRTQREQLAQTVEPLLSTSTPLWFKDGLIKVYQSRYKERSISLASALRPCIDTEIAAGHLEQAITATYTLVDLYSDGEEKRAALLLLAQLKEKHADQHHMKLGQASLLKEVMNVLRKAGNCDEETARVHRKLIRAQEAGASEFIRISASDTVDMTPYIDKLAEFSTPFASLAQIMVWFTNSLPNEQSCWESAKRTPQQHLIDSIFPPVACDWRARQAAPSPQTPEEMHRLRTFQRAGQQMEFAAQLFINPMLVRTLKRFHLESSDVMAAVGTTFVQDAQRLQWFNAFRLAFAGEFAIAGPLLASLIENGLRAYVEADDDDNKISTALDDDGVQDSLVLDTILERFGADLEAKLGVNTFFSLKVAFSRIGWNYRNNAAHGLMPDSMVYSHRSSCIVGLALRLCMLPIIDELLRPATVDETKDQGAHDDGQPGPS